MGTLSRILLFAAVIPPAALLVYIYRQDKVEKEPLRLLLKLLAGGAVSVLPAAAWERFGAQLLLAVPAEGTVKTAVYCFAVVALAEEGCKFFFLRRLSWRDEAFNYRFDGIVYAVFVSMGFAAVENLLYVAGDGTLRTALLRGVTAIPGHAAFAVFMGFYYGCAKRYDDAAGRCLEEGQAALCRRLYRKFQLRAVWTPVLLHGLYDFLLAVRWPWMSAAFAVFVLALVAVALHHVHTAEQHDTPI